MSGSGALPRVPWRQSFGAKVALSILGTVAVLLGATLLAVRIETERQISSVTESATQRSRVAFADIVSIQEQRLSDILDPITGSRRTLLDREGAETGNGNRFVPGESVADGGEYGTDQAVGRGLRQR